MTNFGQITDNESFNSIAPIESLYPDLTQNTVSNATADALDPEPSVSTRIIYWYHPDYVGNVDLVTDLNQEAYEFYLYNPWGESLYHWESGSSSWNSPYRFNSKEFDAETGMNYYGARYHHPKLSVWMSVDPLAHKYIGHTPFGFLGCNPIIMVDPDGRGHFINEKGKVIGNDGKDDGKIYLLKTSRNYGDEENPTNAIDYKEQRQTIKFIKENSGNSEAFGEDNIAHQNSVELVSDSQARKQMSTIVKQDDGKGGTEDKNNREYGGVVRGNEVIESPAGAVASPKDDSKATISHPDVQSGDIVFHSHPSGSIIEEPEKSSISSNVFGGETRTYSFGQLPSAFDLNNAKGVEYVFARGDNMVYIYSKGQILGVMKMKHFENISVE